jgi:hypothetical protein
MRLFRDHSWKEGKLWARKNVKKKVYLAQAEYLEERLKKAGL